MYFKNKSNFIFWFVWKGFAKEFVREVVDEFFKKFVEEFVKEFVREWGRFLHEAPKTMPMTNDTPRISQVAWLESMRWVSLQELLSQSITIIHQFKLWHLSRHDFIYGPQCISVISKVITILAISIRYYQSSYHRLSSTRLRLTHCGWRAYSQSRAAQGTFPLRWVQGKRENIKNWVQSRNPPKLRLTMNGS